MARDLFLAALALMAFGGLSLIWFRRESRALDRKYGPDPK